jgi:hypothetical protein
MPTGLSRDEIEARAYAIWEAEGRPHGRHEDHWRTAHAELSSAGIGGAAPTSKPATGKSPVKTAAASAAGTTPSTKGPSTRAKKTTGKAK